jgi:hypothetical protein
LLLQAVLVVMNIRNIVKVGPFSSSRGIQAEKANMQKNTYGTMKGLEPWALLGCLLFPERGGDHDLHTQVEKLYNLKN